MNTTSYQMQAMVQQLYQAIQDRNWEQCQHTKVILDQLAQGSVNPFQTAMQIVYEVEGNELVRQYFILFYDGTYLCNLVAQRARIPLQNDPIPSENVLYDMMEYSHEQLTDHFFWNMGLPVFFDICLQYGQDLILDNINLSDLSSIEELCCWEADDFLLQYEQTILLNFPEIHQIPRWKEEYIRTLFAQHPTLMTDIAGVYFDILCNMIPTLGTRANQSFTKANILEYHTLLLTQIMEHPTVRNIFDPQGYGYEWVWMTHTRMPEITRISQTTAFQILMQTTLECFLDPFVIYVALRFDHLLYHKKTYEVCQRLFLYRQIVVYLQQHWGVRT